MTDLIKRFIYISGIVPALILCVSIASCTADRPAMPSDSEAPEGAVENLGVFLSDRDFGISISTRAEGDENESQSDLDLAELVPYTVTFDENTIIQMSQQTENQSAFQDPGSIYRYRSVKGAVASWDDEYSYNFKAYNQEKPLEWRQIGDGGSYNGGFALYAMYFPREENPRQNSDSGSIHYFVMDDQRELDNLWKSDIMGAYHSTPDLQSRIKFKLHHLMIYLRIRLYVPLFDEKTNTGFREGALQYATIDNVTPEFSVDWRINRKSDDQGPALTALDGDGSIIMYQHPIPDGETEHPVTKVEYKKYLWDTMGDQGLTTDWDDVRVYDFSVIIPVQKGMINDDGKTGTFTETDFLNFYFRTNSGADARYYFNQAYKGPDDQWDENRLELNQGNFQYIELYVPRVGKQLIYMGGKVEPWDQFGTRMLLETDDLE